MKTKSLSNPNLFKLIDEITAKTYYGYHQECYATEWQRLSGCGPCAASNIIRYMNHTRDTFELEQSSISKETCLPLMEEIWKYVTPTTEGIPTTKIFYENVLSYAKSKGLNLEYAFCDLPEDKANRPELNKILIFLEEALLKDVPIAFLNLCNGQLKNLEPWHWVTIISLEYEEDGRNSFVNILDEGIIKRIDFELWYNTTTLGGGFVYFTNPTNNH
ncbi:hypothetical protein [Clostridium sp.]|uniref:hypothetical protein n=1 Tax=Clostridium sp. TaxID=1506 RepID=UPI001A469076|nr:hypothetical protein [Clostridium sp.]MBK5235631.1 hypothetical protein [Clostridium sp.]